MPKLLDLLKLIDQAVTVKRPATTPDRRGDRSPALAASKYPLDGADIESVSEYRLASLMQYPHY